MFNLQRSIALKHARIALRAGNLEGAYRILSAPELQELREGQELTRKLTDALIARAEAHARCANHPEALLDLKRAIDFGGARPDAVKLRNEIQAKLSPAAMGPRTTIPCPAPTSVAPVERAPAPEPAAAAAPRLYLWIDGVGTYLIVSRPRIAIGRYDSSADPDVPLAGRVPGLACEIIRTSEKYVLSPQCEALVNGKRVPEKVLAPGDRIRLGTSPAFTFYVPCPLSTTAVLRLDPPTMLQGKATDVLLLDQFMVIGRKGLAHVRTTFGPMELVLMLTDGRLWAKSKETITVEGSPEPVHECALDFGRRIGVEGLSFTVTEG